MPAHLGELTDREVDVLRAIARDLSNAEIATELFHDEATLETHATRILTKLGLRDQVQAMIAACEIGLVVAGDNEFDIPGV